jgi:hypothetical protein
MAAKTTTVEKVLAEIASRQHGVVSRRQLLRAGVTRHEIEYRRGNGALPQAHRGVYRVGHARRASRRATSPRSSRAATRRG